MLKRTIFILLLSATQNIFCQQYDTTSFRLVSRLSFYSHETDAQMLLLVPQTLIYNNISVTLRLPDNTPLSAWSGNPGKKILILPVNIDPAHSDHTITADISVSGHAVSYRTMAKLIILKHKPNEVKVDRFTGGLIANERLFFPFGFYCYSPVSPTLAEEEVVKGFNLMSPYQKILPETLNERKKYMDQCSLLGMRVNFNLLSVSGGGGVGSSVETLNDRQKKELLINEINTFKDHPALLSWYIADEPNGNKITPDSLLKIYNIVKSIDPWHPATIVFMAPFMAAKQYDEGLDIVMADPYPVPDSPVSMISNVTKQLTDEFHGRKPVWIVPQAFGGGEHWSREPSLQEIRSMTYQAIINGATGIQYFVRQGLNLFPKSTATWGECGRMAVEIAELTPWILSDEETVHVSSGSQNIVTASYKHDGKLLILTVNKTNSPVKADFAISRNISGKARVIFENRSIQVNAGYFSDYLSAYGSQAYMIDINPAKDTLTASKINLITDPGFEDSSSPGVPASCYARNSGGRGATFFLDTREHAEGNHSVRFITPVDNGSIKLRFFPVKIEPGQTYIISIRAKADTGRKPLFFDIAMGEFGTSRFLLSNEWKEYTTIVTIPYDNDCPPKTNIILQMPAAGTAWFDMLQVYLGSEVRQCIDPELSSHFSFFNNTF